MGKPQLRLVKRQERPVVFHGGERLSGALDGFDFPELVVNTGKNSFSILIVLQRILPIAHFPTDVSQTVQYAAFVIFIADLAKYWPRDFVIALGRLEFSLCDCPGPQNCAHSGNSMAISQ